MEPQKTPNCQGSLEEKTEKLGVTIFHDFRLLYKTRVIQIAWCCMFSQSCLILCDSMDGRSPGSSVHGISQAGILMWVAISSSRESSQPGDQT